MQNQDRVAIALLAGKKNGTYLEIGGARPTTWNNTYLLETQYGWRGVSVEWDKSMADQWPAQRKNPCLCADATILDYDRLLTEHGLGTVIDYLQLDIDPPENTLKALERINLNKYSFAFVTFEHDLYQSTDVVRKRSREIFQDHGYTMLISDVRHNNDLFEDWYVLERLMPNGDWREFQGDQTQMNGDLPAKMKTVLAKIA